MRYFVFVTARTDIRLPIAVANSIYERIGFPSVYRSDRSTIAMDMKGYYC